MSKVQKRRQAGRCHAVQTDRRSRSAYTEPDTKSSPKKHFLFLIQNSFLINSEILSNLAERAVGEFDGVNGGGLVEDKEADGHVPRHRHASQLEREHVLSAAREWANGRESVRV